MKTTATVLGLLGPSGSGKDLVADWLVDKQFVKIAFADPMKRFVQRTFRIATDPLWGDSKLRNEEFSIDMDWWYSAIGALPQAVDEILNHVLLPTDKSRAYLALLEWFSNIRKTYPTKISARVILQTLGTEWGRAVDPMMWARYCYQVIERLSKGESYYPQTGGVMVSVYRSHPAKTAFVVPDHRFKNEVEFSQWMKGYVIRLRRLSQEPKEVGVVGHQSEKEQKELPDALFDLVLNLREFSKDGVVDTEGLHRALEPIYEEQLWTRGNTVVEVSPPL